MSYSDKINMAKDYPIENLLNRFGIHVDKTNKFYCPFHPDEGSTQKGGSLRRDRNVILCFSSNCIGNTAGSASTKVHTWGPVDFYMQYNGVDFKTAVEEINTMQGYVSVDIPEPKAPEVKKKDDDPEEKRKNFLKILSGYVPYDKLGKEKRALVDAHIEQRKLHEAVDILHKNKYDIGLYMGNVVYILNKFAIVRYPNNKANYGPVDITFLRVYPEANFFTICEGITDALSIAHIGHNAISLNSVNNVDKFIARFNKISNPEDFSFCLALDNDEAGVKAHNKLLNYLKEKNVGSISNYWDIMKTNEYIDVSEHYIATC